MRIVTLTWARNEEDILEDFLQHTASLSDELHLVLHRCTDASKSIAEKLQREGTPLHIREDPSPIHRQGAALTEILGELRDDPPDFIVPLDADEFLLPDRRAMEALSRDHPTRVPWKTYVPTPQDPHTGSLFERMQYRRATESKQYYKVIIPGTLLTKNPDLVLEQGSHDVSTESGYINAIDTSDLWLAHFPVRSEKQLRRKIIDGWESTLRNPNRSGMEGYHWQRLYDRCLDPRPITKEELHRIALEYASNQTEVTLLDPISGLCVV